MIIVPTLLTHANPPARDAIYPIISLYVYPTGCVFMIISLSPDVLTGTPHPAPISSSTAAAVAGYVRFDTYSPVVFIILSYAVNVVLS